MSKISYFVNEVRSLDGPAERNLCALYLDLFRQDVISNFLPRLAQVGSATEHALVSYNAYCKIIDRASVILSTHYFWCHVAWSA